MASPHSGLPSFTVTSLSLFFYSGQANHRFIFIHKELTKA